MTPPVAHRRSVSGGGSRCTYHAVVDAIDRTERYLTACHEAGHAVAAVLRGGTFDCISIEPTVTRDGFIHTRGVKACDAEFVIFAGPWADARADWPALTLDRVDGDGSTFDDYLTASMRANANDLRQYVPERDIPFELLFTAGREVPQIPLARDQSWYVELETCWPTIQLVASMLMSGVAVTAEAVGTLLADARSKSI